MKYKRPDGSEGEWSEAEWRLVRRALRRGHNGPTILAQAKAIEKLVALKVEAPWARIRTELEAIAEDWHESVQSGWAAAKAERLLRWLDGEDKNPDAGRGDDWFVPVWLTDEVDEDYRAWHLHGGLEQEAWFAYGWPMNGSGSRHRAREEWIASQVARILALPDDEALAAAEEWLFDRPDPPESCGRPGPSRIRRPVTT